MKTMLKRWLSLPLLALVALLATSAPPAHAAGNPVCLFEHINYAGASLCVASDSGWIGAQWNDRVSSVKLPPGYQIQLYWDAGYGGKVLTLAADTANLVPLGFNDQASSYRIIAPRKSAKRGIAYNLEANGDLQALSPGVSWWYNWSTQPAPTVRPDYRVAYGMDYITTLWNDDFDAAAVEAFLKANPQIKYMLVLNEPNLVEQANKTPQQAAAFWPKYEAVAAATGVKIVGPQITYGTMPGYGDPIEWLDAFYTAYRNANGGRDPQIDYLGFHWYDYGLDGQLDRLKKYGKKFWVTEMANWHSQQDGAQIDTLEKQKAQMKAMVAICEGRDDVVRYAWFTGRWNNDVHYTSLLGPTGQLTELGRYYLSLPY